jgi:uncharacterized protein (TIGR01615 family)
LNCRYSDLTHHPSFLPSEIIIDASFADNFLVPRPTPRYAAILAALPDVLVIHRAALIRLVDLLSAEIERCFDDCAMPLPPWRRAESLHSKWEVRGAGSRANSAELASEDLAALAPVGEVEGRVAVGGEAMVQLVGFNVATSPRSAPRPTPTRITCPECVCCGWRSDLRSLVLEPWAGSAGSAA